MAKRPILTCEESCNFEQELLGRDPEKEWVAMNKVADQLAHHILLDFNEFRPMPRDPHILVLAGKGHNGGDALLSAHRLLKSRPRGQVTILPIGNPDNFKPNTQKAFCSLAEENKCRILQADAVPEKDNIDISLDGILGMQFSPPLRAPLAKLIGTLNRLDNIGFRAAVDLPTGLGDQSIDEPLRADFTYATGIAKAPLFTKQALHWTGRIRYIDIGFFNQNLTQFENSKKILTEDTLKPIRQMRPSNCDKRSHGHLFCIGGSRHMPGALLLTVRAALRSGVGLVTAFAPESVASQFAAVAPEAMWVPWPETPDGGLSLEGQHLLREKVSSATALATGPGIGVERETQILLQEILKETKLPTVIDADALQPEIIKSLGGAAILTPHLGEMARLTGSHANDINTEIVREYSKINNVTTLLKGPLSWITNGEQLHVSSFGSPVLARGGSGDLLTGIVGGLLAQGHPPMEAADMAAVWHGQAAEHLARNRGQTAVTTTLLLNYMHEPLRP
ncbi:MAG: NAD(P)H-hydrate dehydratase [Opitutae bacterium]|nr:NAD(P)H-hydrate dehydratase [Opitutae bacterium]